MIDPSAMINIKRLRLFYRERYIFIFFSLALGIAILDLLSVPILLPWTADTIPLHYNIFFGIDRIGFWFGVLTYPFAALGVVLLNFIIAYFLFTRDKYLSYYLGLVSAICSIVTIIYLMYLRLYI